VSVAFLRRLLDWCVLVSFREEAVEEVAEVEVPLMLCNSRGEDDGGEYQTQ